METKLIVHGAGGAGTTVVAKTFEEYSRLDLLNIETRYIDTTNRDINHLENIDAGKVFIIDNGIAGKAIDGSGGVRESLDSYITTYTRKYAESIKHEDGDIHVIVSSASGGSGSLITPRLADALLSLGKPVLCVVISDLSSTKYCETTLKTLAHLDLLGRKKEYCIPTVVIDNDDINLANARIGLQLKVLSLLTSGHHKAIDSADVLSFISNKYEKNAKGMYSFNILTDKNYDVIKDKFICTMRVLSDDDNFRLDPNVFTMVDQYKTGFITDDIKSILETLGLKAPIFYTITKNDHISKVTRAKEEFEKRSTHHEDKNLVFEDMDNIGGISI